MQRILIIDDDDQIRVVIRRMLEGAGYAVIEAPNGKEGLRCYRLQAADLVITDIFMPEMEGFETIRELRKQFPSVKIIAMSGGSDKTGPFSTLPYAKKFGSIAALAKPFGRQELLDLVREVLAGETVPR